MSWFEIDKGGLAQLLDGKDKAFVIRELVQNAWDEPGVTEVTVELIRMTNSRFVGITVTDDAPEGFYNIKHAYTLFADTRKRGDPEKRGRFNLGEKQILAICRMAVIKTTTGTVFFAEDGTRTHNKRDKTEKGSIFQATIRMTTAEEEECLRVASTFLPPAHIKTVINKTEIPARVPIECTEAVLKTEHTNGDGVMRPTQRKTVIEVHEVRDGEKPMLYEMGLPVVELEAGDPWHICVCQRVPLNTDRDNVSPAFLRDVRAEVLNLMANRLTEDQAADAWVSEAAEDDRIESEAVKTVVEKRFGKNAVVADPNDPESKERAIMAGYTIVPSRAMSRDMWSHVREAGAVPSSSSMFGSVEVSAQEVPKREYTEEMATVAEIAVRMVHEVQGRDVNVRFVKSSADSGAQWAEGPTPRLTFNVTRLGKKWFAFDNLHNQIKLIIHEMGHKGGGHLEASYIDALCEIGATLFWLDRRSMLVDINHRA
jgi:hypothetical protein